MTSSVPNRRRGPLVLAGVVIAGAVGVAAIGALMYGLAVLVWLLMRELFVAIGRALVDGIAGGS